MKSPSPDYFEMLKVLDEHHVDFIVTGGLCAVLQGAPLITFDLDLVHSVEPDNIERLLLALEALGAHSRAHHPSIVKADASHLSAKGHLLLQTRFGQLDLLGTVGSGEDYKTLLNRTVVGRVRGLEFRMLDLETLIKVKEDAGRPKDKAALPILRAALEEKQNRQGREPEIK